LFWSSRCVPFFAHDDFFPSPPSSPQLPSYAKAYAQILASCPSPSPSILPQSYDKFVMHYIDFEVVEKLTGVTCIFPLFQYVQDLDLDLDFIVFNLFLL
jgi:hypothetical protein